MKALSRIVPVLAAGCAGLILAVSASAVDKGAPVSSLYSLMTTSLQGKPVDLADYKGKVTLVVNVASECGFTPQYKGLEALHQEFAGQGFSVLGFPSNEFGGQEPGSPEQIATFCKKNYGVSFPIFQKSVTKPGPALFGGRSGEPLSCLRHKMENPASEVKRR